eukprot:CAMPEP_0197696126 /NCGR_PEP_ID=MMETSP1338-20131121/116192_1 /TAXON_ID=43686 ORGANISM="Pelagodinium beii, Strain RCC1491" /NCGR_SAMPLE_ID=MMETSP1338 /ASSEMBLY_ACC=CAM_ASM_000754 /LENGTH=62 /DNA_ID=CAMNT_0043279193 /DNA_START=12 /DNA_END=197 /DNA_ORIENTATION=+
MHTCRTLANSKWSTEGISSAGPGDVLPAAAAKLYTLTSATAQSKTSFSQMLHQDTNGLKETS